MKEHKSIYEETNEEFRELSESLTYNGVSCKFNEYKGIVNKIVLENDFWKSIRKKKAYFQSG